MKLSTVAASGALAVVVGWVPTVPGAFRDALAAARPQAAASAPVASRSPEPILDRFCVPCHNEDLRTAGLALDAMDVTDVGAAAEAWEKVVRKLRARLMPPAGRPRPTHAAYDAAVSYIETALDDDARADINPGRTDTLRRLSRTEYRNAIRDLLALDIDVASLLPADDLSHGFDNVSLGGLSPTLLDRYLSSAATISRLAVGTQIRDPLVNTFVLPSDLAQDHHIDGLPFGTRGGLVRNHTFPVDGEYLLAVRLGRDRLGDNVAGLHEAHQLEVTVDGERAVLWGLDPASAGPGPGDPGALSSDDLPDVRLNVRTAVRAGLREVGVAFLSKSSALIDAARQPFQRRHTHDTGDQRTQPVVYSLTITGPLGPGRATDTPSRRRILVCHPLDAGDAERCAKLVIATLARRAYRRPVTDEDLRPLLAYYHEGWRDGGFDAGIELALRGLLANPHFLFRIERDAAEAALGTPYRISDVELASRLSFFLWSSIPDDELLDLAIAGSLREPAVTAQQVRRMLADERSSTLVTDFAGQWLQLRNVAAADPDSRLFPDFDEDLRRAFRRETELLFESVAREDRSVLDLLNADYTFVNERLARHYGIPNVYGGRFRRVALGPGSVRGGLLGQGSILTVTSYPTRTSPVLRGKWILENLLGTPPPPPPPDVPPLPEGNQEATSLTMRERMVAHRRNAVCAACHAHMDPVGLSLENFDAVGRWRSQSEAGTAIDASGALPDGTAFDGAAGLRQALLDRPDLFVTTFTEKLLTFALGRGLEYYDAPAVRAILREASDNDYLFSSIVQGIVRSVPFRMRRSAARQSDNPELAR